MGSGMITYELSVDHNGYPDLTVWDRMQDGKPAGFRVNANEGFVFYDPTEEVPATFDPVTGEEMPGEVYYSRLRYLHRNYDWNNFSLTAVAENTVGGGV